MNTLGVLLAWSFLFPIPTLLLSAAGLPRRAGALSWLAPLSVFGTALAWLLTGHNVTKVSIPGWIPFLPDSELRLTVDALACVMLLVVGGVATCVYVYAMAYMKGDDRQHRFFAFLDFFVAAMVLLVVAGNLSVLLVGWTGVGIASFLLISFWWQRGEPLQAGYLALGANAIGDAALLIAAVLVPKGMGELTTLPAAAEALGATEGWTQSSATAAIAGLLVVAACAKSAQGPLWWWLPSAMAGPTPVSALIHAATMVAAGVYLLVRTAPLLAMSDLVSYNVALVGLVTALGGGLASLWQQNFKRGLAYSTVSQLGWMFAAIGLGAPFAALFHLITHASFKAMLFLSAGTVIAATHHEEDIEKLGGLRKHLPAAHAFFALGTLALIGTPLITAGSFSKDAILEGALHSQWPVFGWILLGSVVITGAYAGRLFFGVFYGAEGSSSKHAHDPGSLFTLPLIPLALGAVGLGWIEASTHALSSFLTGTVAAGHAVESITPLGLAAWACGLVGVGIGYVIATKTKSKCIPAPPAQFTNALLGEFRAIPEGIAQLHSGRVSRYALISLVGAALMMFLAQRPSSGSRAGSGAGSEHAAPSGAPSEAAGATAGQRAGAAKKGGPKGAAIDDSAKRARPAAGDDDSATKSTRSKRAALAERMKKLLEKRGMPIAPREKPAPAPEAE